MGMFILLQTPIRNVGGSLVFPLLDTCLLLTVVVRLLFRKGESKRDGHLCLMEVCAILFSIIVLYRHVELFSVGLNLTSIVGCVAAPVVWGPLLVALGRLHNDEVDELRRYMALCAAVIGLWGGIIYLTNNSYFMETSIWGNRDTVEVVRRLEATDGNGLVLRRVGVMGIYTVLPYAVYYLIWELVRQTKKTLVTIVGSYIAIALTLLTVGMSVTRSLIFSTSVSVIVILSLVMTSRRLTARVRARTMAMFLMGLAAFILFLTRVELDPIIDAMRQRVSQLGLGDSSVDERIAGTVNAMEYIRHHLCLLGASGPDPLEAANTSVDCSLFFLLWIKFGLIATFAFVMMWFEGLRNVLRAWSFPDLSSDGVIAKFVITTYAIFFSYVWLVGYQMHPSEAFFTMLFLLETRKLVVRGGSQAQPLTAHKNICDRNLYRPSS